MVWLPCLQNVTLDSPNLTLSWVDHSGEMRFVQRAHKANLDGTVWTADKTHTQLVSQNNAKYYFGNVKQKTNITM
jgi:hypothetical protein